MGGRAKGRGQKTKEEEHDDIQSYNKRHFLYITGELLHARTSSCIGIAREGTLAWTDALVFVAFAQNLGRNWLGMLGFR